MEPERFVELAALQAMSADEWVTDVYRRIDGRWWRGVLTHLMPVTAARCSSADDTDAARRSADRRVMRCVAHV